MLKHIRLAAESVEALTAAVMLRGGVSWDGMSSELEISKQALHKRLARLAEALFAEAQIGRNSIEDRLGDRHLTDPERERLTTWAPATRRAARRLTALRRDPDWWHTY